MKKLIHETAPNTDSNYQLWADVTPVESPAGFFELKFESVWAGAKNPTAPQTRGSFLLSNDSLKNLRELLNQV